MSSSFRADLVDGAVWGWIKALLMDPEKLAEGLAAYQSGQDREHQPLRERLQVVEDLLAENRLQQERLLDLYLLEAFPKDILAKRTERLETTIAALLGERANLMAQLQSGALTSAQIEALQEFGAQVAVGLESADQDFATQRRIIEMLDVRATLALEGEHEVAYVRCRLDQGHPRLLLTNTCTLPAPG